MTVNGTKFLSPQSEQACVVVTGCSTGIGWGTAKVLLGKGYCVFGSVRKAADAARVQAELGPGFTPLLFDITDESAVTKAASQVAEHLNGRTLFGLVNNAGVSCPGPLLYMPLSEFQQNMDINVLGTLIVTRAFVPLLGADKAREGPPGRVIMMSSIMGRGTPPFLGAYVASKHALEGASNVLRVELMVFGIDVIVIGPGPVATPIWEKAEALDLSMYDPTVYAPGIETAMKLFLEGGRAGYSCERIGRVVLRALTARWPWARYAPVHNRLQNWTVPLLLPARFLAYILSWVFSLRYLPPSQRAARSNDHSKQA